MTLRQIETILNLRTFTIFISSLLLVFLSLAFMYSPLLSLSASAVTLALSFRLLCPYYKTTSFSLSFRLYKFLFATPHTPYPLICVHISFKSSHQSNPNGPGLHTRVTYPVAEEPPFHLRMRKSRTRYEKLLSQGITRK